MLTDSPIEVDGLLDCAVGTENGAVVVFSGVVRAENGGRGVVKICYEAYRPMAERELARLETDVRDRFGVSDIRIVHRLGDVRAGEVSLFVAVSAVHRGSAFEACAAVVDEVKRSVPIWKKEYYVEGDTEWL